MNSFYTFVADHIIRDVENLLTHKEDPIRVLFTGLPLEALEKVFVLLCGDEKRLRISSNGITKSIPVLLVDPLEPEDPQNLDSGRCSNNHLVVVRNTQEGSYLALHAIDDVTNLSSETAAQRKGVSITNHKDIDEWMSEPFVKNILIAIYSKYPESERNGVEKAVKSALKESWECDHRNRDRRTAWGQVESIFKVASASPDRSILYKSLGSPALEDGDIEDAVQLPKKIAEFFVDYGYVRGLENLINELSDDENETILALEDFVQEISVNCLIPSEFLDSPMANYALGRCKTGSNWWAVLTDKVWKRVLGGGYDIREHQELEITCQNVIFDPIWKSHPLVVQRGRSFFISNKKGQGEVVVEIKRAAGNKSLNTIATITLENKGLTWVDDTLHFEHDSFIKYQFTSDSIANPYVHKVIDLGSYKPQISVNCRSSTKITPFKFKKKKRQRSKTNLEGTYECNIELNGVGSHTLDLYHRQGVKLPENMVSCFGEIGEQPERMNIIASNESHAVCLVEAAEDCAFEFELDEFESGIARKYVINVTVNEFVPKGVSSEFRKLIIESGGRRPATKVDVRQSMLSNLEHWILSDKNSFYPLILGSNINNAWAKPIWDTGPIISDMKLYLDPRPSFQKLSENMPESFFGARDTLRKLFLEICEQEGDSIESLKFGILYLDEKYRDAINQYVTEYFNWLSSDYEMAIWTDIVSVHSEESSNGCLKSVPDAILLSPFHPVRIAWHCNAQSLLQRSITEGVLAPASGVIDPSVFPDCLALPCLNANASTEFKGFAAVRASSDYWNVLWNTDEISNISNENYASIFSDEFGLTIDGLAQGFSIQQVKRSLDDVQQLACAKSTLSISLSSDTIGASSCNSGIEQWCEENLGLINDEWSIAGGNSIRVYDTRPIKAQPEPAILASLTARSGTNVRWYKQINAELGERIDLAIIDHLKTMSNSFEMHNFRSAIDLTGLFRKSVKHSFALGNMFLAESRVGYYKTEPTGEECSLRFSLLKILETMEGSCIEYNLFDSLTFAPNLKTLEDSLVNSDFCAVSSSTVDASCFNASDQSSFLWDYELPKYSSDKEQSSGFYLLARESENMHEVLKSALIDFADQSLLDQLKTSELLREISKRGMPTLKKLTSGGTSSLGEIGMLVAVRLLQTDVQSNINFDGLIPASIGPHTNLIIPADIFQPRFDSLRENFKQGTFERPDLIVISIRMHEDSIQSLRLTPIEVKARSSGMTAAERSVALNQAKTFSTFLEEIKSLANKSELWGIAWREMLASWIDYGYRVYGEFGSLKKNSPEWSKRHQATMISILTDMVDVEIDTVGRLITLEKESDGQVVSTSGPAFKDTVVLSYHSALSLLNENQEEVIEKIRNQVGDWALLSSVNSEHSPPTPPNPLPEKNEVTIEPAEQQVPPAPDEAGSPGIHFKVGDSSDKFENKETVFYPGNTALNNINIGVVGDLGTGKTQLLKALVYQLVNKPENNRGFAPKVLILDYKKDFSDTENEHCKFISKANVKVIKPHKLPLNMFNTTDSESPTPWLDRYSFFRDMLSKIFSTQKPIQDANLKTAVRECFSNVEGRDPTVYEVFNAYVEIIDGKMDTTYTIMSDIIDYEIFESNPDKIVSFEDFFDGTVALDLSGFSDDKVKNMIIVIFLNFYYDYMKNVKKRKFLGSDPQTRFIDSYLLVDEAHNIMPYEFPVLSKLLLQGREFGVGVIMASQYFSHFKTNKENYMEPIQSWFIHKVPGIKASDLDRIGLPNAGQSTINRIASLEVFESFCKTLGHNGEFVRGIPFYKLD